MKIKTVFLLFILPIQMMAQQKNSPENGSAYNRTNESDRFSPLDLINEGNVAELQLLSTFD